MHWGTTVNILYDKRKQRLINHTFKKQRPWCKFRSWKHTATKKIKFEGEKNVEEENTVEETRWKEASPLKYAKSPQSQLSASARRLLWPHFHHAFDFGIFDRRHVIEPIASCHVRSSQLSFRLLRSETKARSMLKAATWHGSSKQQLVFRLSLVLPNHEAN